MSQRKYKVEGVKEINPNHFGGMCSRALLIKAKQISFENGIETIATTEAPAVVVDWERWQFVREILPMRYAEMPKNDKVPLLDSHSRFSIEMIKGSAVEWRTEADQLLAKIFISKSEEVVRQKIEEGHIDSVSIGYETNSDYTVEIPKNAAVTIDGISYKNDFDDDMPLLVRTWWKTKELSLVPIGADEAAKFKSIANESEKKFIEKLTAQQKSIDELQEAIKELKSPTVNGRDLFKTLKMRLTIMKHELKLN